MAATNCSAFVVIFFAISPDLLLTNFLHHYSTIFTCPSGKTYCDVGGRRFQRTYSPLSVAERYYTAAISLYRNKGATTVAFIYEDSAFGKSLYHGARDEVRKKKKKKKKNKTKGANKWFLLVYCVIINFTKNDE